MMLNNSMPSSSHWRVPSAVRVQTSTQSETAARAGRSLRAVAARGLSHTQPLARRAGHAATISVLAGGVLVAPALALLALVSLLAPLAPSVRQVAPALIFAALLWLSLAILGAHAQAAREAARCAAGDQSDD